MFEKLSFREKKHFIRNLLGAIVDALEDMPSDDPKMYAIHAIKHIEGACIERPLSDEERNELLEIITKFFKLAKPQKRFPRYKQKVCNRKET